jgi:hypothetical protein
MIEVPKLSTGDPSTLGSYRKLTLAFFGEGPALAFIDQHIADDPDGEAGVVIADERQMIYLLMSLTKGGPA